MENKNIQVFTNKMDYSNSVIKLQTNSSVPKTPAGNAKMGSRRIFAPDFKIKVLNSYRNDSECKGNQRATARKYGIHRRQIQKWLQCENSIRDAAANLNQNNVKHQFHNISHQMPKCSAHTANTNNNKILSLDTARHNVALNPLTLSPSSIITSAAAAAVITTTTTPPSTSSSSSTSTPPTSSSCTLQQHTLHTPTPYKSTTHTPVTIISHLPPTHLHYHHHHQYPHNNYIHHQTNFMPSASLPTTTSGHSSSSSSVDISVAQPPPPPPPTSPPEEFTAGNRYNDDYEGFHHYYPQHNNHHHHHHPLGVAPIDLSLGRKPEMPCKPSLLSLKNINFIKIEENICAPTTTTIPTTTTTPILAVDLSCRKRKSSCNSPIPEKMAKIQVKTEEEDTTDDDDEENIEVGNEMDLAKEPVKPVKLFKPYLLNDEVDGDDKHEETSSQHQHDPIIWSHSSRQCSSRGSSTFQSTDSYPFPSGSPIFQGQIASPLPASSFSPTCPKGSPVSVSGYESSSSTYSDYPRLSHHHQHHNPQPPTTYSIDLKMQSIDSGYYYTSSGQTLTPHSNDNRNHVQRWLDHDGTNIALRQGIAY